MFLKYIAFSKRRVAFGTCRCIHQKGSENPAKEKEPGAQAGERFPLM
jgi:hypothetical protein